MKEVWIVSAVRTPIGRFGGVLSSLKATTLGAKAIEGALNKISLDVTNIEALYMGNVIAANLGQAPAKQVAIDAGLGANIPSTLVNKVCASGMKSIMIGSQSVMLGHEQVVITGGMESMSNIPFYLPKARYGYQYGNGTLVDGLAKDGLTDPYQHYAMGVCSDHIAKEMNISREEQDAYAMLSYKRANQSWSAGKFNKEVIPITITSKKGDSVVNEDEEFKHVNFDKIPQLKPVFSKEGTATAANASTISDGAAALVLMSKEKAVSLGIKPLAKVISFADAAQKPIYFTTSPSLAIPKALNIAGIDQKAVDYYEINEAFSSVALANCQKMNIDAEKVNINGGAVALGHPIGASGARIMVTLINVLKQKNASIGVAAICNGGGGASAMVIENM